jgi:hypothetical protein
MRAAWMMLGVLWLGCSVQLTGAPCADDLQCPAEQRCGAEAACVEGARTAELLGESCRMAVRAVAARASECIGGAAEDYVKVLGPEVVCQSVEASVAAGRQVFRPEEFGACLRGLRQTPCGNLDLEKVSLGTMLEGCPAFVPQVAAGGACANTADCQGGWCSATDVCPGVCRAFIPFSGACTEEDRCQEGSSCAGGVCRRNAGLEGICTAGVQCDPNSNTYCQDGRCVARKTSGSCTDDAQCALGFRCVKTAPALGNNSPRECRSAKGAGAACEPGAGECALFSYCDAGTRACRSWPGPGERCGDPNGAGEVTFCLESRCEIFGLPPVCLAYNPVGGGCLTSLDCGPSAACRKFRCVPLWCQ